MTQAYLKEFIRQSFDCTKYLKKSKGTDMFCCPVCGSGCGPNGTGAVHYYANSRRWYCRRCRTLGDIFTIYEPDCMGARAGGHFRAGFVLYGSTAVPDCMTLPLFPSCRGGESVSRQQRLAALASIPVQIRQEVTVTVRVSSSRRIVSITLQDPLTRIHNRPIGR